MGRVLRTDRVILEGLEDKYGTEAIAQAILNISDRLSSTDAERPDECGEGECGITSQEAILDFIKYVEGVRIRLREIHWETDVHSKHILTDSIIGELEDFEDNIAEDLMGMCGFRIKVGMVVPTMTTQVDLLALLCELNENASQLCACLENDPVYAGIVNELEDLFHNIGKWKYLATFK